MSVLAELENVVSGDDPIPQWPGMMRVRRHNQWLRNKPGDGRINQLRSMLTNSARRKTKINLAGSTK